MEITKVELKTLQGLLFWLREKRIMNNYNLSTEQAEKGIKNALDECEFKGISKQIQSIVLNADVHSDILDIVEENNIVVIREL